MTDVTPDSVGLLWTVPEGEFDSFTVQYKDRDGQPHVVSVAADLREVTIPVSKEALNLGLSEDVRVSLYLGVELMSLLESLG